MQEELVWRPTPKQEQFIALPDTIFEAFYGGAVGGGKTDVLLINPLARLWHEHPRFKALILRRTLTDLQKEIIPRSEYYYGKAGAKYNEQKKIWKFPSGALVYFGHAEHEKDIKNYDGVEWNYIGFDELTKFTEWMYLYLVVTRCRSAYEGGPAIARSSGMPGDIGNAWVRRRFVEPNEAGGKIILDQKTGHKRFFVKSMPYENPYLLKNTPDYLDRLNLLSEAERKAKLGDWWSFEGQVFDQFRIEPLSDEPENARHVIEPFNIPDFWPKVNLTDWGFTANTVSLWGALSPEGVVYVYREYCVTRTDVSVWATEIGEFNRRDKNLKVVGIDTNAWDQRGEEETIADQFIRFSKLSDLSLSLSKASKARISGKILIQEYLRWKQKPRIKPVDEFNHKYAELLLEKRGIDAYNEYLNRFKEEPEESNLPKLKIFNTCTNLIQTIPLCVYDDKNKEDVAEFPGDDSYDCLRYLLKAITKYIDESKEEFAHLQKLAFIENKLNETKDWTTYNMARQFLEARRSGSGGIPRFHKGMHKVQTIGGITYH